MDIKILPHHVEMVLNSLNVDYVSIKYLEYLKFININDTKCSLFFNNLSQHVVEQKHHQIVHHKLFKLSRYCNLYTVIKDASSLRRVYFLTGVKIVNVYNINRIKNKNKFIWTSDDLNLTEYMSEIIVNEGHFSVDSFFSKYEDRQTQFNGKIISWNYEYK